MSFQGMGDLSSDEVLFLRSGAKRCSTPPPVSHRHDESQPPIPQRVGLHRSPLPLHRLRSECCTVVLPVEQFAANGQQCLIRLSQPRGPLYSETKALPHSVGDLPSLRPQNFLWRPIADAKCCSRRYSCRVPRNAFSAANVHLNEKPMRRSASSPR